MRNLFILTLFGCVAWFAFSPVYYFVMGPEVARLPSYLRMTSADTKTRCSSFANDWNLTFPTSGAYCEEVPRWKHWSNAVRNVASQIETYKTQKAASVE